MIFHEIYSGFGFLLVLLSVDYNNQMYVIIYLYSNNIVEKRPSSVGSLPWNIVEELGGWH